MFQSDNLNSYLQSTETVVAAAHVFAEVNLNDPENIERIGVYRYRPYEESNKYHALPVTYDPQDDGDYYTDAEISYAEIGGTYDTGTDQSDQVIFRQDNDLFADIYSLEDCVRHNRPRSGINKLLYLGGQGIDSKTKTFIDAETKNATRPRYYVASKDDYFKYWTSYKQEGRTERGISKTIGTVHAIDDAVPFVVYKNHVPANRLVVKMQTGIGPSEHTNDPLSGYQNARVPRDWSIEVLINDTWNTAYVWSSIDEIPADGHVELGYGIIIPDTYESYRYKGEIVDTALLPDNPRKDDLWLVNDGSTAGEFYIAVGDGLISWESFPARYGWTLEKDGFNHQSSVVKHIVNPPKAGDIFREFQSIRGIRIVVSSMNMTDVPFDLIEMSPRLVMDWSERTASFNVKKAMADLATGATPVGNLMASTGSISLDNSDSALNINNAFDGQRGSVAAGVLSSRIKVSFYEEIINANGYDYFVPIKTLYTEESPNINSELSNVELQLRDLYYLFESMTAPSVFMSDVSLSRAIMTIMDNIGFSNYAFKRLDGQVDPIIPFFFIPPDKNVAEILSELAAATQSAIYLDEYNNLIVSTKEHAIPEPGTRPTDIVLRGRDDDFLANIREISSADRKIFNAGKIEYTKRYIKRTQATLRQPMYQPQDQTWVYAPSLLWEVSGDSATKAINEKAVNQSSYTLTAMPLAASLSATLPSVVNGVTINNTMDVGESANYVARYNGYLYANGEIIHYDAVEFVVDGTGRVWITSTDQFQNYLLSLPFRGKMYPTGKIRIFSEPHLKINSDGSSTVVDGAVKKHGRGQFGTQVTSHAAGLGSYWSDNRNVFGMMQDPEPLFSMRNTHDYSTGLQQNVKAGAGTAGTLSNTYAKASSRTGIMKNNISQKFFSDSDLHSIKTPVPGTIQSSALVFSGPRYDTNINPRDHVTYVARGLDKYYTSFGTRCRIIGKREVGSDVDQNPFGSTTYYSSPSFDPASQINIAGGSGGIGIHVDPSTNAGYFFEIGALTSADPSSLTTRDAEIETSLGRIVRITQVGTHVDVDIDTGSLYEIPTLSAGDAIAIEGVYGGVSTGLKPPDVNGVHLVDSITNNGTRISFTILTPAYTWLTNFGSLTSGGAVVGGPVVAANINDDQVVSITTRNPTGLWAGSLVSVTGFDTGPLYTDINVSDAVVTSVSSDGRTITFKAPLANQTYISFPDVYLWKITDAVVTKDGTRVSGTTTSLYLSSNRTMNVTRDVPHGLAVGDTITVSNIPDAVPYLVPNTTTTVTSVSEDGKSFTYKAGIVQTNAVEMTTGSKIKKTELEPTSISNMWFYKTVADDRGGIVRGYVIKDNYIDFTVDSHKLSIGDFITVSEQQFGNIDKVNGNYQVVHISDNTIRVSRYHTSAPLSRIVSQPSTKHNLGLTHPIAVTKKLWSGIANILVDDGLLYGQYRALTEDKSTVYDLNVEFVDSSMGRTFHLYVNNRQIATVVDKTPLVKHNHMALFVRGQSKLMFEHVYAMGESLNALSQQVKASDISPVFGIPGGINQTDALRKYAVSGFVQSAYLSGLSSIGSPRFNMFFDEFGTIMREAAYFNVRYDKAYPALRAKIAPVLNRMKGYVTSGFYGGAYNAEFMIFNCLDNLCSLDPNTGNYLRINGITFTQNTTKTLTVDDYAKADNGIVDPNKRQQFYDDIKISRMKHGKNEFVITSDYIQTDDAAMSLMGWISKKILRTRKNVGVDMFAIPTIQLGDIVTIDYRDGDVDVIASRDKQFVVYNIEYGRSQGDVTMRLFMVEI